MTTAIETAQPSLPELGLSEAQQLAEKIRVATGGLTRQLGRLRELAVEFYERGGHRTLGYATIEECCRKEFGWSRVHFWRQLQTAAIERDLGVTIGNLPESHARELRRLPADQRKDAYDEAKQDGKTTAADVREAVERRRTPPEPLPGTQEKPEEVCSHGLPVEGHCPECECEYIEQQERNAEEMPEPEQPEQLPGQDAENAQDAILSPSSAPPPLHVPARGARAPQRQAVARVEVSGSEGLSDEDLDWLVTPIERKALIARKASLGDVLAAYWRLVARAEAPEDTRARMVARAILKGG